MRWSGAGGSGGWREWEEERLDSRKEESGCGDCGRGSSGGV